MKPMHGLRWIALAFCRAPGPFPALLVGVLTAHLLVGALAVLLLVLLAVLILVHNPTSFPADEYRPIFPVIGEIIPKGQKTEKPPPFGGGFSQRERVRESLYKNGVSPLIRYVVLLIRSVIRIAGLLPVRNGDWESSYCIGITSSCDGISINRKFEPGMKKIRIFCEKSLNKQAQGRASALPCGEIRQVFSRSINS